MSGWAGGAQSLTAELVRFIAGGNRWTILELDNDEPAESLTMVWRLVFACEPDFSPAGDATSGFHVELNDRQRGLIVSRTANNDATQAAARLIAAKHDLTAVRRLARPPYGTRAAPPVAGFDWTDDPEPRPFDLTAVSVWPPNPNDRSWTRSCSSTPTSPACSSTGPAEANASSGACPPIASKTHSASRQSKTPKPGSRNTPQANHSR